MTFMGASLSLPKEAFGVVVQDLQQVFQPLMDFMEPPLGRRMIHPVEPPFAFAKVLQEGYVHRASRRVQLAGTARAFDSNPAAHRSHFRHDVAVTFPMPERTPNANAIALVGLNQLRGGHRIGARRQ
jgi:hypothetical protein